jgi:hypothetical protein
MKLVLPPKLVEKLVSVQVISFRKISFLVTHLMPSYAETDRSRPLITCKISFPVTHLMSYYAETGSSRPLITCKISFPVTHLMSWC